MFFPFGRRFGGSLFTRMKFWHFLGLCFSGPATSYVAWRIYKSTLRPVYALPAKEVDGKTYIVTGVSEGIGNEVVYELAKRNARVIMATSNLHKCRAARKRIVELTKNRRLYCRECDLSRFDSIVSFCDQILRMKEKRIHGVVLNAAVGLMPKEYNNEGIELQLAVNHLGHFLLTNLLLDYIPKQADPCRIVQVNCRAHTRAVLDFSDLNLTNPGAYNPDMAYNRSKLAQLFFVKELSRRLQGSAITVNAVDPLKRVKTNLHKKAPYRSKWYSRVVMALPDLATGRRVSTEVACRSVLYALAAGELNGVTGKYLTELREVVDETTGELMNDANSQLKLWLVSEQWTRLAERRQQLAAMLAIGNSTKMEPSPIPDMPVVSPSFNSS